jgi:hypothetical protein
MVRSEWTVSPSLASRSPLMRRSSEIVPESPPPGTGRPSSGYQLGRPDRPAPGSPADTRLVANPDATQSWSQGGLHLDVAHTGAPSGIPIRVRPAEKRRIHHHRTGRGRDRTDGTESKGRIHARCQGERKCASNSRFPDCHPRPPVCGCIPTRTLTFLQVLNKGKPK